MFAIFMEVEKCSSSVLIKVFVHVLQRLDVLNGIAYDEKDERLFGELEVPHLTWNNR
jgi:glutamine cyclotransferase